MKRKQEGSLVGRQQGRPVTVPPEEITPEVLAESTQRVQAYAQPYQRLMPRSEHRGYLLNILVGLLSGLERKSLEPIAVLLGLARHVLQHFVGGSRWAWAPLRQRQWQEVAEEIGTPDGTLVLDGSATPKKGTQTVGVARQWCGHLGKVDNCVVGVHATYVGKEELSSLVDSALYLPREWTRDKQRRKKARVPKEVKYKTQPKLAVAMLEELAASPLPFTWVSADDEFGRAKAFRDAAARLQRSYALDVPENTRVRLVKRSGNLGKKRWQAKELVASRPVSDWKRLHVRDAEKGPLEVRALMLRVATYRKGKQWVHETLVVAETLDGSQRWYALAKGPQGTPLLEFVRRLKQRHRVEEVFQEAKGEVGLDHFEVRTWHGWHHHMTLCQIAHWFLVREKRRLGGKSSGPHRQHASNGNSPSPDADANAGEPSPVHQLPPHAQPPGAQRPLRRQGAACPSISGIILTSPVAPAPRRWP